VCAGEEGKEKIVVGVTGKEHGGHRTATSHSSALAIFGVGFPLSPAVGVQHSDPVITSSLNDDPPTWGHGRKRKFLSGFVIRCNSSSNRRFRLVCFFFRRTSWSLKECRDLLGIFRTPQGHSGWKMDCLYHQVKHRSTFSQFPWNVQVENCTLAVWVAGIPA
jgi:hypothetical protein